MVRLTGEGWDDYNLEGTVVELLEVDDAVTHGSFHEKQVEGMTGDNEGRIYVVLVHGSSWEWLDYSAWGAVLP